MVASPVHESTPRPPESGGTPAASAEPIVAALTGAGYAIVDGLLDDDTVHQAHADLAGIAAHTPTGRDDFEGANTRRVYALFAKTRTLDVMATHPVVLGVLDRVLGDYQLSAPAAISIGPGEVAQPQHPDDAIYPMPRPHQELVVNVMWPLQEFTKANGATRIVAGSHRWIDERPDDTTPTTMVEMPPRTALVYLGSVWHGGGANHTEHARLGVVLHYASAWLRPVENHVLSVPPDMARNLPTRLQELLGYNIYPPFIGYVDGRHPRKLLTPSGADAP
jgi:ectoine hydroxylase-related dioxygenase (phytanoyl-CoA dioxygenase family)